MSHIPVLLNEVIESLNIRPNGLYIDGTFGGGGYTKAILQQNDTCRVIAFDRDAEAIEEGQKILKEYPERLRLIHSPFSKMADFVQEKVHGIVLDIGVSSMQIDEGERGFSFQKDGPLDMRMNREDIVSAFDVVNTFSEQEIADILYLYGEERRSRLIAKKIVQYRMEKPIETTIQLANLIKECMPYSSIHPATRSFQALRIYVNDELGELKKVLVSAKDMIQSGGVLSVVSFHSLEDRIVKTFFKEHMIPKTHQNKYKPNIERGGIFKYNNDVICPNEKEVEFNPRSRSAKLRYGVKE